ncbi:hypothetical protein [Streptomyces sp. 7N604]
MEHRDHDRAWQVWYLSHTDGTALRLCRAELRATAQRIAETIRGSL